MIQPGLKKFKLLLMGGGGFSLPKTFYFDSSLPAYLVGATYSVGGGKLTNTPGLAGNVVLNGTFAAWTANNPDNWTTTEAPPATEVSQVGTGQGHGGAGAGMCNIFQGAQIRESVLTDEKWFRSQMLLDTIITGQVQMSMGQGGKYLPFDTVGTRVSTCRATGTVKNRFLVHRYQGNTDNLDVTIDDVQSKQITLANLFCVWTPPAQYVDSDYVIEANLSHAAHDKPAIGLFIGLDDPTNPQNFVTFLAWPNPHPLAWAEKCVAGTYTTLVEKQPDNPNKLKIEKIGRKFFFWVNDKLLDEPSIVSDSLCVNTKHGPMVTDPLGGISNITFSRPTPYSPYLGIDTPRPYQVHQRDGANQANISIGGTLKLTGVYDIEASFNGGAYADIAAGVNGPAAFTGTLLAQAQGQGTLTVRVKGTGYTADVPNVGVGEIFAIGGQSNASGRGTNNQSYSHATLKAGLYGNNYAWEHLTDPTDSGERGQPDTISYDNTAAGSVWPLVATLIMANQNVPVAFVPCAMSGTSITQWAAGADHLNRATLYGSMNYRRTKVGAYRCVLFWQGEKDAFDGMTQANYNTNLDTFANAWAADATTKIMPCKFQHCTSEGEYPPANQAAINAAIGDAWADNANVLTGPDLSGLDSDGGSGVHITTSAGLAAAANLWWLAIKAAFGW